ncbi:MAG TPA: AAA family ATPase [Pyrinomonadaceae bacterium]|nr:AAA family ATPase [Pyrinomonadaceae bacterium]
MKIIEKIEIKNFRSFLGTKKSDEAVVYEVSDLNIFSGSNDSGKSNILRALNLFFNGEIDSTHQFNFDTEFSLLKREGVQKVIEITLYFRINNRSFSISKFYNRDGYRNFEYIFQENGENITIDSRPSFNEKRYGKNGKTPNDQIYAKEQGYRRYAQRLISSTSFSYVPAIRDERFFSHLYGKIILQIKTNEDKAIEQLNEEKRKIERFERTLGNKSENKAFLQNLKNTSWRISRLAQIDKDIKDKSSLKKSISELETQINNFSSQLFSSAKFLSSEFKIGNNLKEFFESFDIGTGEQKDISLRLRGDGIQAKFIPEMLNFLDLIQESKQHFIWGFEEPENSAEYKNQRELADKFKNTFIEKRQIFLTTHSEEFLSLYDGSDLEKDKRQANLYHVKKVSNKEYKDFSIITLFDVEKQTFEFATVKSDIERDIGSSLIRATYSKELKEKEDKFLKEKEALEKEKKSSEDYFNTQITALNDAFPENVFICEDENAVTVWKRLFEKLHITKIEIISSKGCTVNDVEIWIRENKKRKQSYAPKVFRSLDRDGYSLEQIEFLEKELKEKYEKIVGNGNYLIKFLPVNELENFAILCNPYFTKELIETNIELLEDAFIKTATSSLDQSHKKFNKNTPLFNYHSNPMLIKTMEREAKKNPLKFLPGKDIKSLKPNFNADKYLRDLDIANYPTELTEYLNLVKEFFKN